MRSPLPNDRLLRLAAERQLTIADRRVEQAVVKAMRGWLAGLQTAILHELRNLTAAAWPASRAVDDANQTWEAWRVGLDAHILPAVSITLGEAFQQQRRVTPGSSFRPQQDYMAAVADRLRIWPVGAFEKLRPELLEALSDAVTIEEMSDRIGRILNIDASTRDLRAQIGDIDKRLTNPDLDPVLAADLKARRRALWNAHDHEMNQWRWKARRIARTEAHGAVQYGQLAAARQAEQETGDTYYKRWLATDDTRTRPSHVVADGQMVRIGEKFRVGGFLLDHPGDPITIAPHETINCRCSAVIVHGDLVQDELQGPRSSLGAVAPGGRRLGPDNPDDAHAAAEQVAADRHQQPPVPQRGEDYGQAVPVVPPADLPTEPETPLPDIPDDLTTVDEDGLIELLIAADNANNDALFERVDAEFERRATGSDQEMVETTTPLPDYQADPEPDDLGGWWGDDEPAAPQSESDRLVDEFTAALADPNITDAQIGDWEQRIAAAEAREHAAETAKARQIEVWKRTEQLVEQTGMDYDEAEAQVTGKTIEQLRRTRFVEQAVRDSVYGADNGFEAALKSVHDNMVAGWYLEAENATNGHMLRRTSEGKFDSSMFWSVNEATARKHMSDELAAWFDENGGRVTRNDLREMIDAGQYTIQQRRGDYLQ